MIWGEKSDYICRQKEYKHLNCNPMADSNQIKSNRDRHRERLAKKYPEKEFADDEALFGQINDDYDEYDRKIAEAEERQKAFSDMFTGDPRSARLMMDWKNGGDPAMSLIRIYGDDILDAVNDPEKQEELAEARKEYAERLAKSKELDEAFEKNMPQSLKTLETYASEKGIPDEKIDEAMETLATINRDYMLGKITPETVELMLKAINYEADIETAAMEGEVAGRNAKIEEKLRKSKKGDGTAQIGSKHGDNPDRGPRRGLGALDRYEESSGSIWDKGEEKRTKRN